eukprot:gb/GFBE01046169.1/.p1 GENE.gb/GFBE01046169.1/~~gb/GFBE01046169.1/.p1  ORF type:complete len:418 (+),score=84.63 gb/GFBE01046169.1/:1-1254(+)
MAAAELRALCAGCRKPLSGTLLANSCNHVFHRDCLHKEIQCGRCERPIDAENALSLFGLGFEGADDAISVAVMTAIAAIQATGDLVSSDDEAEAEAPSTTAIHSSLSGAKGSCDDLTESGASCEGGGGTAIDLDADLEEIIDEVENTTAPQVAAAGIAATQLDCSQEDTQRAAVADASGSGGDPGVGGRSSNSSSAAPSANDVKQHEEPAPAPLEAPSQEVVDDVARICLLRQRAKKSNKQLETEREQLRKVQATLQEQQDKLKAARKISDKREAACTQFAQEIHNYKDRCHTMSVELNQVRQRDAVLEYWEEMRSKGPQDALTFLTRTVNIVGNPWKILTQVARLRDYHRSRLDSWDKESAQAVMRQRRARIDLEEVQQTVSELQAKIQQQRQLLQPTERVEELPADAPAQKRPRR